MDDNKEYNVLKEISIIGDEIRILTGLSKILEELANNDNGNLSGTDICTLTLINRRFCYSLFCKIQELEGQLDL